MNEFDRIACGKIESGRHCAKIRKQRIAGEDELEELEAAIPKCQLPKLDVAGSSPVSRSMFSVTYASGTFTSITSQSPVTN